MFFEFCNELIDYDCLQASYNTKQMMCIFISIFYIHLSMSVSISDSALKVLSYLILNEFTVSFVELLTEKARNR